MRLDNIDQIILSMEEISLQIDTLCTDISRDMYRIQLAYNSALLPLPQNRYGFNPEPLPSPLKNPIYAIGKCRESLNNLSAMGGKLAPVVRSGVGIIEEADANIWQVSYNTANSNSSGSQSIAIGKSYIIYALLSMVSPTTSLLYITSGLATGKPISVVDSSRAASTSATAGWLGYEFADDHPGVTGWLGKASAEAKNEWGYAGVNAYLGKGEAEAKAEFAFMKTTTEKKYVDGKWEEKTVTKFVDAEVGAGVSVSVVAADAEAGVGSDMLGAGVEAKGGLGNAKAETKGEFSITDDGVNANVQGEAMVSAAEGEVSGTINILGIEIKGKVGGYAGAVGVEGKIGIEDNKFVMEGGAAALLGVSGGVEIGFNDEGWDNFVDFVTFWD